MVRNQQQKAGSRPYQNYDENTLEEALTKIVYGEISVLAASKLYKIAYETLLNQHNGKHNNRPGAPAIFSDQDEKAFQS